MAARTNAFMPRVSREPQPLSAMNITPLIDVLLVLLVMMILTIPMVTHKIPILLPQPGAADAAPVVHRIDLAASGTLAWDGAPIADATLPAKLAGMQHEPRAELQIASDGAARYDRFDHVLATIKQAGITRLGFVGNERFAHAGSAD